MMNRHIKMLVVTAFAAVAAVLLTAPVGAVNDLGEASFEEPAQEQEQQGSGAPESAAKTSPAEQEGQAAPSAAQSEWSRDKGPVRATIAELRAETEWLRARVVRPVADWWARRQAAKALREAQQAKREVRASRAEYRVLDTYQDTRLDALEARAGITPPLSPWEEAAKKTKVEVKAKAEPKPTGPAVRRPAPPPAPTVPSEGIVSERLAPQQAFPWKLLGIIVIVLAFMVAAARKLKGGRRP